MKAEILCKWEDGALVSSLEEDAPGLWILDEEGTPQQHIPAELSDMLMDDLDTEFLQVVFPWAMNLVQRAEQKAYQAGRHQGFGEGRRMVREALGLDALDRIAASLEHQIVEIRGHEL